MPPENALGIAVMNNPYSGRYLGYDGRRHPCP
ncbi:BA14K family protein [Bradyrhizobium canariense]|nr:BA14K family protein [Bradyrhizobium canariense]